MYTRNAYINEKHRAPDGSYDVESGRLAYRRYYGEIIEAMGGAYHLKATIPFHQVEVRKALESGDVNLNTLPLHRWDAACGLVYHRSAKALRERGDYPTLGNAVCILKEAARLLAEETE